MSSSTVETRSPSKKKTRPSVSIVENHSSNRLYFAFVLSTFSLALLWFARDWIWSGPREAAAIEQVARLKLLIRVQSDLLEEALGLSLPSSSQGDGEDGDDDPNAVLTTDYLFLRALRLRSMSAREQMVEPKDRAIFDEFVVNVGKDVTLIAATGQEQSKGTSSKRQMMQETARTIRTEIAKVAPDVFRSQEKIQLVLTKISDEESDEGSDSDGKATRAPTRKVVVKTVVVDENDDPSSLDDDLDDSSSSSAKKSPPLATSKKPPPKSTKRKKK